MENLCRTLGRMVNKVRLNLKGLNDVTIKYSFTLTIMACEMCFFMFGYRTGHRGLSVLFQHTRKGEGGGVFTIVFFFLLYFVCNFLYATYTFLASI